MKLKTLLLVVLALVTIKVDARTPRVKNKSFTYQTIKLPEMALPETRTYSLFLETAADYGNLGLRFRNAIQIPGWNKAAQASYAVDVKFFPVDYHAPFIVARCKYIRDTANRVVDSIFFYRNVYKARGMGSMEISNSANVSLYARNLRAVQLETTGREFRNRKAARKHRNREANRLQQAMATDFVQAMSREVNSKLDVLLGVYPITKRSSLMIVRNKKHKEYSLMNNFWNRFLGVAHQINANSDLSQMEAKLFSEITYLKNIDNKYRGSTKADRKMRYMAYKNLSVIYDMLEMPQESLYYATKIRSNDFREYNARGIVAKAKNMQRLQDIHRP